MAVIDIKNQREVIEEIDAIERTISNYKEAFVHKKIPEDVFKSKITELNAIHCALNWVLGKNQRYD